MLGFSFSKFVFAQQFPLDKAIEFTGTIAHQPVLVELTDTENGLEGRYKYLKIGEIIPLEGVIDQQNGNAIELTEGKSDSKKIWRAVYRQDSIVGKWYSANRKRIYPIYLIRKIRDKPLLLFKGIEMDTLVYSDPADSTSSRFTYSNSRLQARETGKLSQWINAEISETNQNDRSQYSIEENMHKNMIALAIEYKNSATDAPHPEYASWNWDFENEEFIQYQQNGYLSINTEGYQFAGGAHGSSWELYDNYDIRKKKRMDLSDIITKGSTAIEQLLEQHFRKEYDVENGKSLKESGLFESAIKPTDNFFFDDWGITFVYNQYEIAPYAMGIISIFIPWYKLKGYLNREFTRRIGLKMND